MKTQLKKLLLITIISAMSSISFAGKESHGGDGLRIGNKLYVLDLIEAGVETQPFFQEIETRKDYLNRIRNSFNESDTLHELIAKKLTEINQLDSLLAMSILKTIEMHSWRFVNSKLLDVPDEDSSLDYNQNDLVQLAIRRSRSIMINREAWRDLDSYNKAALIFHEAVYALAKPEKDGLQSSPRAREITGYFFSKDLTTKGRKGLHKVVKGKLPSFAELLPQHYDLLMNEYEFLGSFDDGRNYIFTAPMLIMSLKDYNSKIHAVIKSDKNAPSDYLKYYHQYYCANEFSYYLRFLNFKDTSATKLSDAVTVTVLLNSYGVTMDFETNKDFSYTYVSWNISAIDVNIKRIHVNLEKGSSCLDAKLYNALEEAQSLATKLFEIR